MAVRKSPGGVDSVPKDRHRPRKGVFLDPELWQALAEMAKEADRPVSWEIRRILLEAIRNRRQ